MSEELNEYFGYDVRERLIQLGYTTEEEISEQIRLIGKMKNVIEEIEETEGVEAAKQFLNGIMVEQFMNN